MPSRLMIAVILGAWLAMTGLLIHYEVVPMMLAEASPTYQPDLTDEIGAPQFSWEVKQNGKHAGSARSRIVALRDRSFELHTSFHFDATLIPLSSFETVYRVDENRKLQAVYARFVINNMNVELRGEVVGHTLEPRVFVNDVEKKMLSPGKIDVNEQQDPINAMNLVSRLRGLREGQTWTIHLLDLSRCINLPILETMRGPTSVIANVKSDTLVWKQKEVACFKIEYHESGKDVTARTWVRKSDGMVLQQESVHLGTEMVLERVP